MPKRMVRSAAQIAAQKKAAKASAMKRKFAAERKANSDKRFEIASSFYKTFKGDPDPAIQQQVRYARNRANIILGSTPTEKYPAKKPMTKAQNNAEKDRIKREREQYYAKLKTKGQRTYSTGKLKNTPAASASIKRDLLGSGRHEGFKQKKLGK